MRLRPEQRLGPYTVVQLIGSGGMGEVYRAKDERLNRFVAIKVIAGGQAAREEARTRFTAEGRAIAALNHPHICALYDTGIDVDGDSGDGRPYLVMEYLEGETLAERLQRGTLLIREVLGIAIEIADALAYAHRHNIVHRDLKPANVFVTRTSGVKLLDFGLAAMHEATVGDIAHLSTQPLHTLVGVVTGTLHYMAPERLDGKRGDTRSDLWALGAILYEMLAGRRPYDEPTAARLINAILTHDPEPLPPLAGVPAELTTLVMTLLSREPDDRWQSVRDVAKLLRGIAAKPTGPAPMPQSSRRPVRTWPIAIATAALLGFAGGAALVWFTAQPKAATTSVSFVVPPPPDGSLAMTSSTVQTAQLAMSPDGSMLAFVAAPPKGRPQLFIRRVADPEPRALAGTDNAAFPFWSPDNKQIGFFADTRLKTIAIAGGPAQTIAEAPNGRGGTWSALGEIVFAADGNQPLQRVSLSERKASPLAPLPPGHTEHRWPQFLPGDRRVLFLARSKEPNVAGIYVVSLDDPQHPRRIRAGRHAAAYASGHLLYIQNDVLIAERLDLETLRLSGQPVPLGLPAAASSSFYSAFSATETGALAVWAGSAISELVWFDRQGNRGAVVGPRARYIDFRLAPDESKLAVALVDTRTESSDLRILDLTRGVPAALASSDATDATPIWDPRGDRIIFRSNRDAGVHDLFIRPAYTGGADTHLFHSTAGVYPTDWSSDGRKVLYHEGHAGTGFDIGLLDLATNETRTLIPDLYDQAQAQFGTRQRIAFMSADVDESNIYVRRLDGTGGAVRISTVAGHDPRWRADGRELYFIDPRGQLVAAQMAEDGLQPTRTDALFPIQLPAPAEPYLSDYVVSRDGQRFLVRVPLKLPQLRPITLVLDWQHRLTRP